jgi:DNA-binding phage protein
MEQITLELPTDLAQRFYTLSAMDKNAITAFVSSLINNKDTDEKRRLKAKQRLLKTMKGMGQKATERGMTEEILQDILEND